MPKRVFVSAFGDPGHAFPAIALSRELDRRGCDVALETADKWRGAMADTGVTFIPAPEFPGFPGEQQALSPYAAVTAAIELTQPAIAEFKPDVVVYDILTLAPALAAERLGIPVITTIPHVSPVTTPGSPPYGLGASPPRTPFGRALWGLLERPINRGLDKGASEYNELRKRCGLPPREGHHAALSPELVLVGTFPQLEHELLEPERFKVTGPMFWEPDFPEVEIAQGSNPLVLVAPSTAQDPAHEVLGASLLGLGALDIRVISTWNRRPMAATPSIPPNTQFVEWLSYSKTMSQCDVVVSHGGHGTIARTLQAGAVPVVVPFAGDQFENAARVDAAGLGVRLPKRLISPTTLRLAVERALSDREMRVNAEKIRDWSLGHDGAARAADLILGSGRPQ